MYYENPLRLAYNQNSDMSKQSVNDFLHYGFLPKQSEYFTDLVTRSLNKNIGENCNPVKKGEIILRNAFQRTLTDIGMEKVHLLPLSGGLDSRLILSLLDQNIPSSHIELVTWGYDGHDDAEIAKKVAKEFDQDITYIDISTKDFDWSLDALLNYAHEMSSPNQFFMSYIYYKIWEKMIGENKEDEYVYWTGFMGDPSSGSLLREDPPKTWNEAQEFFARERQRTDLTPECYDPTERLPSTPVVDYDKMAYDQQLFHFVYNPTYVLPNVVPPSASFATPFMDEKWLSFILNRPVDERENRQLFKKIVGNIDKRSANTPTTANNNLPLNSPKRELYIKKIWDFFRYTADDFGITTHQDNYFINSLRNENQLYETVERLLTRFDERTLVETDMIELLNKHIGGQNNYNPVYTVASLELFLQVNNNYMAPST